MMKPFRLSDHGFTLVELLVTISLTCVVSSLAFSHLIGGLKNFKSVNNQISLHNEANVIMTQFVNQIYVAKDVEIVYPANDNELEQNPCKTLIKITKTNGDMTTLGFDRGDKGENAMMNSDTINSSGFSIVCNDTEHPTIHVIESTVYIDMTIQDNVSGKQLELNNKVSFVKVDE